MRPDFVALCVRLVKPLLALRVEIHAVYVECRACLESGEQRQKAGKVWRRAVVKSQCKLVGEKAVRVHFSQCVVRVVGGGLELRGRGAEDRGD